MKAIYVKPPLKFKEIDAEESMLTGSGENNLTPASNATFVSKVSTSVEVESTSALSKQGSFHGDQWDDEE